MREGYSNKSAVTSPDLLAHAASRGELVPSSPCGTFSLSALQAAEPLTRLTRACSVCRLHLVRIIPISLGTSFSPRRSSSLRRVGGPKWLRVPHAAARTPTFSTRRTSLHYDPLTAIGSLPPPHSQARPCRNCVTPAQSTPFPDPIADRACGREPSAIAPLATVTMIVNASSLLALRHRSHRPAIAKGSPSFIVTP
jgi:hypothetical protein